MNNINKVNSNNIKLQEKRKTIKNDDNMDEKNK